MSNYFIIHGSYGNPYKNFIPWLKKELGKRKLSTLVPSFPTTYKQDYESWSKILRAYVDCGLVGDNTTFIAHSLGSIFVIKFILDNKINIKKIITIARFNNVVFDDDYRLYESFYINNLDISNIELYCKKRISFYSDNDPYVGVYNATLFSRSIKSEEILIKGAGHFNERSGYKEFRELLKYI